jgi:hypothetical protein
VHDALEALAAGGDAEAVFDETFATLAGDLDLGLAGRAWKRRMLRWVLYGARDLAEADVAAVEKSFEKEEGSVVLRGRIDRLDRCPQGSIVRDYKTGEKVDTEDERQLDVYLLAEPDAVGAVFELLRPQKRKGFVRDDVDLEFGKGVERVSAAELDARRGEMRALVAGIAAAARAGRLNVHPSRPEDCTRAKCDGYELCRVQKARWLARAAREVDA